MKSGGDRGSGEIKCPAWMMTFGDCMSLLATFFVMLIAFSNFEEYKLARLFGSLKGALGATPTVIVPAAEDVEYFGHYEHIRGLFMGKKWLSVKDLSVIIPDARMAMRRFGSPKIGLDKYITVCMLDEGLAFIICVKPLFKPGTSVLLPGNENMLKQIGGFVEALANEIKIIGVVDESMDVCSSTAGTPCGVGIERAMAIQNALINECGFSRDRFGIGAELEHSCPSLPRKATSSLGRNLRQAHPELQMPQARKNVLEGERMEVIIVGRRIFEELSPEEVVIRDKW